MTKKATLDGEIDETAGTEPVEAAQPTVEIEAPAAPSVDEELNEEVGQPVEAEPAAPAAPAPAPAPTDPTVKTPAEKSLDNKIPALLKKDVEAVKEMLAKEPKVHFMIPLAPGEKKSNNPQESVRINGHVTFYPKGEMVIMPQSHAELLSAYLQIPIEAKQAKNLDNMDESRRTMAGL